MGRGSGGALAGLGFRGAPGRVHTPVEKHSAEVLPLWGSDHKQEAADRLDAWLAWASRSRLKPFIKLARTLRKHKPGVLAAVELGLSKPSPRHVTSSGKSSCTCSCERLR